MYVFFVYSNIYIYISDDLEEAVEYIEDTEFVEVNIDLNLYRLIYRSIYVFFVYSNIYIYIYISDEPRGGRREHRRHRIRRGEILYIYTYIYYCVSVYIRFLCIFQYIHIYVYLYIYIYI